MQKGSPVTSDLPAGHLSFARDEVEAGRASAGLCDLSIIELAAELRHHEVSPLDAVSAVCDRIKEFDHLVHAVVTLAAEQATASATELCNGSMSDHPLPPLWGVPITIKDLTPTKGIPTTRGSALQQRWAPDLDAVAVERLRRAGAIVVGKTNTSEDGWKAETSNRLFPPTVNPWDPSVTAGGSSGGAAAAVACGFGPLATGTDGAGSARIPAAFCGVIGFKPTFGAVPYWPPSPERLSHFGVLCKTVEDVALTFDVLKGPDMRDPDSRIELLPHDPSWLRGLRVGVVRQSGSWPVDPEIHRTFDRLVDGCSDLWLQVRPAPALPDVYDVVEVILSAFEAAPYRNGGLEEHAPQLDQGHLAVIERGLRLSAGELAYALEQRQIHTMALNQLWSEADLLIMPSTSVLPFTAGHTGPPTTEDPIGRLLWAAFSYPWNLTGDPACSLPAGFSSGGLPIGIQLVGPSGHDQRVLACSRYLERSGLVGYRPPPIDSIATSASHRRPAERSTI